MEYLKIQQALTDLVNSVTDENANRLCDIDPSYRTMKEYVCFKLSLAAMLAKDIYSHRPKKAALLFASVFSGVERANQGLYKEFNEDFIKERLHEYAGIHDEYEFTKAFFRHIGINTVPSGFENFAMDCINAMQAEMDQKFQYRSLENQAKKSGGCYIATCVYGSYDCPEVWVLRRFRDKFLAKYKMGKSFIKLYYFVSPKMVSYFGRYTLAKRIWKVMLDKTVVILKSKGYSDTRYFD